MNVDEAMAVGRKEKPDWYFNANKAAPILAAEAERLRAELAEVKADRDSWRRVCEKETEAKHQAWTELAAAKAASVCPVELVALGDADWECSVGVKCKSSEDADRLYNWLRDRTKDKSPPEA